MAIFINKVHKVVRLYKYRCVLRHCKLELLAQGHGPSGHVLMLSFLYSVPKKKLVEMCPDCPVLMSLDNAEVQKAVSLSLEKFNQESGLDKKFALLKVERATAGVSIHRW